MHRRRLRAERASGPTASGKEAHAASVTPDRGSSQAPTGAQTGDGRGLGSPSPSRRRAECGACRADAGPTGRGLGRARRPERVSGDGVIEAHARPEETKQDQFKVRRRGRTRGQAWFWSRSRTFDALPLPASLSRLLSRTLTTSVLLPSQPTPSVPQPPSSSAPPHLSASALLTRARPHPARSQVAPLAAELLRSDRALVRERRERGERRLERTGTRPA